MTSGMSGSPTCYLRKTSSLSASAGQTTLPRRLATACQRGSGRPGLASPFGRGCGSCRHATSYVVLAGRAPNVPYPSDRSGHRRTTTVRAHARRAAGSGRTERSEGASQARGGPRWGRNRAANDRNAADNHGQPQPSSVRLNSPPRPSTAGHGHPSIRSDTEAVGLQSSRLYATVGHLGGPATARLRQARRRLAEPRSVVASGSGRTRSRSRRAGR